jgi:hypothetical protein
MESMATTRCNKTYFIARGRVERICGVVTRPGENPRDVVAREDKEKKKWN